MSSEQTISWRRQPPVFISSNADCRNRSRAFLRFVAATNRARRPEGSPLGGHPSGSSERRCCCLSPWRLRRPRRTLVPQPVQWVHHRLVAAEVAPIPGWLTLRAIRRLPHDAPFVRRRELPTLGDRDDLDLTALACRRPLVRILRQCLKLLDQERDLPFYSKFTAEGVSRHADTGG